MVRHEKIKRRKGALECCFVAPDIVTTAAIEDEAEKQGIPLYRKGHSLHHIYADCDHSNWNKFYYCISNRAIEIGRVPAWLERQIRKSVDENKKNRLYRTYDMKPDPTMLKTASPSKFMSNRTLATTAKNLNVLPAQQKVSTPLEKMKTIVHHSSHTLSQRCANIMKDVKNWLRPSRPIYK